MSKLRLPKYILWSAPIIVLFLALPAFTGPYLTHVLLVCFWWATIATSWNLMAGYTGQISFGHAALTGIGGYTTAMLSVYLLWPTTITVFLGGITALIVGIGLAFLTLRVRGPYFLLVTLALNEILRIIIINEVEITRGTFGLRTPPLAGITSSEFYYYLAFIMMIIVIFVEYKIVKSSFGLSLMAIRDDEDVAAVMGVNTLRQKIIIFAISSFIVGLSGAFYVHYARVTHPELITGSGMLIIMASCMIGGSGTILGPILGAFLYELIYELCRPLAATLVMGLHLITFATIMLVVLIFAPGGILPLVTRIGKRIWIRYGNRDWAQTRKVGENFVRRDKSH